MLHASFATRGIKCGFYVNTCMLNEYTENLMYHESLKCELYHNECKNNCFILYCDVFFSGVKSDI